MSEWQPIETARKDGTRLLVFDDSHEYWIAYYSHNYHQWIGPEGFVYPTHWMPLPAEPLPSPPSVEG